MCFLLEIYMLTCYTTTTYHPPNLIYSCTIRGFDTALTDVCQDTLMGCQSNGYRYGEAGGLA